MSDAQAQPTPTGLTQPFHIQTLPTKSSTYYPPPRGVPWNRITAMVRSDTSCPGCHFNKPDDPPRLKFHQEVGCPALEKHGHICRKDVTALATIVKKSNKKPPRTPYQPRQTEARRASEETGSETASASQVHSPSIPTTESPPQPPPSLINFTASSSRHKYHPSSESSSAGALVERVHRTLLARFG